MRRYAVLLTCSAFATSGALAQSVPRYNIDKICDAARANPIGSPETAYEECIRDETHARQQLEEHWDSFSAQSQETCVPMEASPSTSSYTYVLTCLQEENSKQ